MTNENMPFTARPDLALKNSERWLPTKWAELELGLDKRTLRSYRDCNGGPLVEKKHWRMGLHSNSPVRYEVVGISLLLHNLGKKRLNRNGKNKNLCNCG